MEGLVAVPFLLLVGALLAVQAGANVQLSSAMAHPFSASALQLTIGAALLIALATVLGTLGALGTIDDVAAWHLLGGLGSAIYITAGILLFPRLGAVLTVGLFIAGQMVVSLALDTSGWLGVDPEPLGPAAVAGAAAVTAGAALIARSQAGARPPWGWLGGLCGATYVTSVFLLIPEIGVAPTIGLTVAGQQIASVLVDRYGLLRLPRRPLARARLAGVAALLAGVALIHA